MTEDKIIKIVEEAFCEEISATASQTVLGIETSIEGKEEFFKKLREKIQLEFGKAKYGIIDSGLFGVRIISGIVTGIRYTEDKPIYELSFANNKWWTTEITDDMTVLLSMLKIASLDRVKATHGLLIKYK
jgi:hypothetical protein